MEIFTIPAFIHRLQSKGVILSASESGIEYKCPLGALTILEKEFLTSKKIDVVNYLKAHEASAQYPFDIVKACHSAPSPSQEMWWRWMHEGAIQPQFKISLVEVFKDVSVENVQVAIVDLLLRHEVLRYSFRSNAQSLSVVVNPIEEFKIEIEDLNQWVVPNELIKEKLNEFLSLPLPVEGAWLFRAKIIIAPPRRIVVVLLLNHILVDGASCDLIRAQLREGVSRAPSRPHNAENKISFSDFSLWQRNFISGSVGEKLVGYWRNWLKDKPPLKTPQKKTLLEWKPGVKVTRQYRVPPGVVRQINVIGKNEATGPFLVYLTILAIAVAGWSGQNRFLCRSTGDLRTRNELVDIVGLLICGDPLEVSIQSGSDFLSTLHNLEAEYRAVGSTRLPALQRFPPYLPGLNSERADVTNKIAVSINFFLKSSSSIDQAVPGEQSGTQASPELLSQSSERWFVPIAPMWLTISESETDVFFDLQLNEDLIDEREQQLFISTLFSTLSNIPRLRQQLRSVNCHKNLSD